MNPPRASLWRHRDFLKLWAGQSVSEFGSTVTREALPLTAVLTLGATPAQMGLLAAAASAPLFFIGLLAGAWVDRRRRRPILITADLGRALLLLSIPLAALFGHLRIEHLYLVALLAGTLSVFFDVAYQSFLPAVVSEDELVEGNSKLGMSSSVAEIGAPALAGALVQLLTGPFTILIDAISFLFSASSLLAIRTPEPPPPAPEAPQNLWADIVDGLHSVWNQPLLRIMVAYLGVRSFFGNFFGALYGLYVLETLGMSPASLGILVAGGGIGALAGAFLTEPLSRRFGLNRTLLATALLSALTGLLIPLAAGAGALAFPLMLANQIVGDLLMTICMINTISLRQRITPTHLLGRTVASSHFIEGGLATAGVLVGGGLGQVLGIFPAVVIAITGILLATGGLLLSPLRTVETGTPRPRLVQAVEEG